METIHLIVRNIVFIVLLAAFLEMLLPLKETRRFLDVVVGLFVLLSILNPLVSWLNDDHLQQVELEQGNQRELDLILEQGEDIQKVQNEQVFASYGEQLEEQICAAAQMVPGVSGASANLGFSHDNPDNQPVLKRVELVIEPKEETFVEPVEKVEIRGQQVEPEGTEMEEQVVLEQVRNTIVALYGLQPEQVVVRWKE
jgi:stage III sporulation protein AF